MGPTAAQVGIGRPFWTFEFWEIDASLQVFFVFEVLYTVTLAAIKMSICFLYLRLFPNARFRRTVWATQAFIAAHTLGFVVADCLQCRPLSFFWESWDGQHEGTCFNSQPQLPPVLIFFFFLYSFPPLPWFGGGPARAGERHPRLGRERKR